MRRAMLVASRSGAMGVRSRRCRAAAGLHECSDQRGERCDGFPRAHHERALHEEVDDEPHEDQAPEGFPHRPLSVDLSFSSDLIDRRFFARLGAARGRRAGFGGDHVVRITSSSAGSPGQRAASFSRDQSR